MGLITFFCLSGRGCIVEEAQNAAEELCAAEGTETCSILSLGIGKTPLKSLCAKLQGSVPQEAAKKEGERGECRRKGGEWWTSSAPSICIGSQACV